MPKGKGAISQRVEPDTADALNAYVAESGFPAGKTLDAAVRLFLSLPLAVRRDLVFPPPDGSGDFLQIVEQIVHQLLDERKP